MIGQLDCRSFKSATSLEQNDDPFLCQYNILKIKSWLENISVSMVKYGFGHSAYRNPNLAVSQEGINGTK